MYNTKVKITNASSYTKFNLLYKTKDCTKKIIQASSKKGSPE
ncbi:hypothetical protein GXM_01229 [Nostoc sphaeroides CCNUC1]|uniref:Uncharacterized protein n=1 Tax=Nostoc sphaeroides CCNUC1 TaxID=2653204 RepID=A0A5P8VUE3_9NOSO|nr:hypothetical protein GXM_01229 [Nostoc sphaeroides CCNUC1]